MEKCGVYRHSTVDVEFDSLPLAHKKCIAYTMLNVRAGQIPKFLASFDQVFPDLLVPWMMAERERLKALDRF